MFKSEKMSRVAHLEKSLRLLQTLLDTDNDATTSTLEARISVGNFSMTVPLKEIAGALENYKHEIQEELGELWEDVK
jgi:hypothetical protein